MWDYKFLPVYQKLITVCLVQGQARDWVHHQLWAKNGKFSKTATVMWRHTSWRHCLHHDVTQFTCGDLSCLCTCTWERVTVTSVLSTITSSHVLTHCCVINNLGTQTMPVWIFLYVILFTTKAATKLSIMVNPNLKCFKSTKFDIT